MQEVIASFPGSRRTAKAWEVIMWRGQQIHGYLVGTPRRSDLRALELTTLQQQKMERNYRGSPCNVPMRAHQSEPGLIYVDWKRLRILLKCLKKSLPCCASKSRQPNSSKPFGYEQTKLQSFSNWENHKRKLGLVCPRYKMPENHTRPAS